MHPDRRSLLIARRRLCRGSRRSAFSLLEVLLALAVFGGGMAAFMHCLHAAERAGARGDFLSSALLRCKTAHGLLESGATQPGNSRSSAGRPVPFADDARWTWTVEEQPSMAPGMVERTVTVWLASPPHRVALGTPRSFSLRRIASATVNQSTNGLGNQLVRFRPEFSP